MHKPVLLKEIVDYLHINNPASTQGGQPRVIDATLGGAGHTLEFVKKSSLVLGIDADKKMLEIAKSNLKGFEDKVILVNAKFRDIDKVAKEKNFTNVDGVLLDLGISSFHLDDFKRGFSFKEKDSLLDMRLNTDSLNIKGSDLLNMLREDQLKELFRQTMEEPDVSRLVRKIIEYRIQS